MWLTGRTLRRHSHQWRSSWQGLFLLPRKREEWCKRGARKAEKDTKINNRKIKLFWRHWETIKLNSYYERPEPEVSRKSNLQLELTNSWPIYRFPVKTNLGVKLSDDNHFPRTKGFLGGYYHLQYHNKNNETKNQLRIYFFFHWNFETCSHGRSTHLCATVT